MTECHEERELFMKLLLLYRFSLGVCKGFDRKGISGFGNTNNSVVVMHYDSSS